MRATLSAAILMLLIPLFGEDEQWELVYPIKPPIESLELLSIGSGTLNIKPRQGGDAQGAPLLETTLVGARSGFGLATYGNNEFVLVDFPFDFDITAITSVNHRWLVGGPNGELGFHQRGHWDFVNSVPSVDQVEFLQNDWDVSWIGVDQRIENLTSVGEIVVANVGGSIYWSENGGTIWNQAPNSPRAIDLEAFHGWFYILAEVDNGIQLMSSATGEVWTSQWEVSISWDGPQVDTFDLNVMSSIDEAPSRLYAYLFSRENWGLQVVSVSTANGESWLDHGSLQHGLQDKGPYWIAWNPLGLPEEYLGLPSVQRIDFEADRTGGQVAGSFGISYGTSGSSLYRWSVDGWGEILDTHSNWFSPRTNLQSGSLIFTHNLRYGPSIVLELSNDFAIIRYDLPQFDTEGYHLRQLLKVNGVTYGLVDGGYIVNRFAQREFMISSKNLIDWQQHEIPSGNKWAFELISFKGSLFGIHYTNGRREIKVWDGQEWQLKYWTFGESNPVRDMPFKWRDGNRDVAYLPAAGELYALRVDDNVVLVDQLMEGNDPIPFTSFEPDTQNPYLFNRMVSPDGENLVAFGDSTELAVIDKYGHVTRINLQELLPDDQAAINTIKFVNGWYYLIGSTTIRTQDFLAFETYASPSEQPIVDVLEYRGEVFGFTESSVFKRPVERGYLESIAHSKGWFFSEWLGWFQIIDEDLGDIDHLLLGECWVKQVNDQQYWLRTETLGWIWMNKDWSPWFWRMDDGHWYWLDQGSWPGRVWDYDDQEWINL